MTHDTNLMPAEACSDFLSDPPDQEQVPEGAAVAILFAVGCVLATLAAVWIVASAVSSKAALLAPIVLEMRGPYSRRLRRTLRALWRFLKAPRCVM